MNDRIKLAGAMGWQWIEYAKTPFDGMGRWFSPDAEPETDNNHYGYRICGFACPPRFDPFTDANDDYDVLEWMLLPENHQKFAHIVNGQLRTAPQRDYRIGDYARAALRVI